METLLEVAPHTDSFVFESKKKNPFAEEAPACGQGQVWGQREGLLGDIEQTLWSPRDTGLLWQAGLTKGLVVIWWFWGRFDGLKKKLTDESDLVKSWDAGMSICFPCEEVSWEFGVFSNVSHRGLQNLRAHVSFVWCTICIQKPYCEIYLLCNSRWVPRLILRTSLLFIIFCTPESKTAAVVPIPATSRQGC